MHIIIPMPGRDTFHEDVLPLLREGNQRKLREAFRGAALLHLNNVHACLAFGKDQLGNGCQTYDLLLDSGVKPAELFRLAMMLGMSHEEMDRTLWLGKRRDQSEHSVLMHARILAEYLRYRLGTNAGYQFSLSDLFDKPAKKDRAFSARFQKEAAYLEQVQHALVEYVTTAGKTLPLNRGAALLHELRGEPGSDIWTRRIDRVRFGGLTFRQSEFRLTYEK